MSVAFASSNSVGVLEFGEQQQQKNNSNDGNKHNHNPLNPLSRPTRQAIHRQLEAWRTDASVTSIVIMGSGGRHFSAGADLTEFDVDLDADKTPNNGSNTDDNNIIDLTDLVDYIESYPKPIVAAIRGVALGGGLELALACHYRVATPQASLGLPEVHVGVIPGAGGTQRLPRLVGIEAAIQMILSGKPVSGSKALELGLIQGLCAPERDLLQDAAQWATWATLLPSWPRLRDVRLDPHAVQVACDAAQRKLPSLGDHGVQAALRAIRASAGPDFDEGMHVERDAFWETLNHPQGRARRYAFFAVRTAQKSASNVGTSSPGGGAPLSHVLLAPSAKVAVGVVGAGLMGSGIALVLLQAGFTVRLVDINDKALQKGVHFLRNTITTNVKSGQWSKDKADAIAARLKPSTTLQDLKDCHLVVEAVLENMNVKQQVFRTLDEVTPREALLLSNTSTLSIDTIASALSPRRRAYCAGWHFFSPAHKMQLVEIVVGAATAPTSTTIAVLQSLTKRIGKIGVTVGNCHGFVGNRMVAPYTGEAVFLVADGASTTTTSIEAVDAALTGVFGMKMGPFAMSDLAGNDIGYFIRKEQGLTRDPATGLVGPNRGERRYTELVDEMVTELGRLGQKAGKGWYDYDPKVGKGRVGLPSTEFAEFIRTRYHGRAPGSDALVSRPAMDAKSIIERVLFPLVNEGFKILEENVAQRPSDIDVIYVYGYGWPVWRGGPMYWADHEVGLAHLLQTLRGFYEQYPGSDWFRPSQLLETCVRSNITVEEYYKRKLSQERSRSKL